MPALLLAIKPRYAEAILEGVKRLELRRRAPDPRACRGLTVVLYASQPACAVVGVCEVVGVRTLSPGALWTRGGARALAGVSRRDFDAYFAGQAEAHALVLTAPRRLRETLALHELRERVHKFHPPQSWCWLREERARDSALLRLLHARLALRRAG